MCGGFPIECKEKKNKIEIIKHKYFVLTAVAVRIIIIYINIIITRVVVVAVAFKPVEWRECYLERKKNGK